jgi:hypothetical protein
MGHDDWDLPDQPKPPSDDAVREAEEFAAEIDHMLNCHEQRYPFAYAEDTLLGIAEGVRKTGRVSEGQRKAVNNIRRTRNWEEL